MCKKVFPNPTANVVTFSTSTSNLKKVVLYNLSGSKVHAQSSIASKSAFEFDLTNLSTGIYLAKITSKKGVEATVKIIKK